MTLEVTDPEWLTVDEGVEDGHGTVGDTGVGVDLLEDYEPKKKMLANEIGDAT